jgi:hypothetical protein
MYDFSSGLIFKPLDKNKDEGFGLLINRSFVLSEWLWKKKTKNRQFSWKATCIFLKVRKE